jgi:hypothetical protein
LTLLLRSARHAVVLVEFVHRTSFISAFPACRLFQRQI